MESLDEMPSIPLLGRGLVAGVVEIVLAAAAATGALFGEEKGAEVGSERCLFVGRAWNKPVR